MSVRLQALDAQQYSYSDLINADESIHYLQQPYENEDFSDERALQPTMESVYVGYMRKRLKAEN